MTHDEFQQLAASGGPATPEQQEAVRQHIESCPECLSVNSEQDASNVDGRRALWWLAIPTVLFLALWIWREVAVRVAREQLRGERAEVVELANAEKVLKAQKSKLSEELAVVSAPGSQTIALAAPAGSAATGTLYIDPASHRAVLAARNLTKTDSEHDYEVWLYAADGLPRSGGIFDVTNGQTMLSIAEVPADLKSVTVTLEKNGGAAQPGNTLALTGHP